MLGASWSKACAIYRSRHIFVTLLNCVDLGPLCKCTLCDFADVLSSRASGFRAWLLASLMPCAKPKYPPHLIHLNDQDWTPNVGATVRHSDIRF